MEHSSKKTLLSRYSAEFNSKSMEESYLKFSWNESKAVTLNTLIIIIFLIVVFFIRDILEAKNMKILYLLLFLRLTLFLIVLCSSIYIHRMKYYFNNYHLILFFNQIIISIAIFSLAVIREMPVAYLGVNTILFTLIFYQFINNQFYYSLTAAAFVGIGALSTAVLFLNISFSEIIASVLFLIPLNFLGIIILKSNNQTRRHEYLAFSDLKVVIDEKDKAIKDLKMSLDEVKTLRGFLPICAKCKKIRDDEGYWNKIESYIEKHSEVQFSHGICQECAEKLYGDKDWFKKKKK